jgi:hypothetical protein
MPAPRRALLALLLLVAAASSAAPPPPGGAGRGAEDPGRNRRELDARRRRDPDGYARLRRDAEAFRALPEARRAALIRLDRRLHARPPAARERLLRLLRRYADWLDALPPADRRAIRAAPDARERLRRVRDIRARQWRQSLPLAVRAELAGLRGQALADRSTRLREDQRERRRDWVVAFRFWNELFRPRRPRHLAMPSRLADLEPQERVYVEKCLRAALSETEWKQLDAAQGQWPRFPRLLVGLADRHPPALDGPRGPSHFKDLPREVQRQLGPRVKKAVKKEGPGAWWQLRRHEGKWPAFAVALSAFAHAARFTLAPDFWPARRDDLSRPVREFLEKDLLPALTAAEKDRLGKAEAAGTWPLFPRTIQELAGHHSLEVPWQTLPGPRARWEPYRPHGSAGGGRPASSRGKQRGASKGRAGPG